MENWDKYSGGAEPQGPPIRGTAGPAANEGSGAAPGRPRRAAASGAAAPCEAHGWVFSSGVKCYGPGRPR